MGKIKIETKEVYSTCLSAKSQLEKIQDAKHDIIRLQSQLSWDVKSRRNISNQLLQIIVSLENLHNQHASVVNSIESGALKYNQVENQLVIKAHQVGLDPAIRNASMASVHGWIDDGMCDFRPAASETVILENDASSGGAFMKGIVDTIKEGVDALTNLRTASGLYFIMKKSSNGEIVLKLIHKKVVSNADYLSLRNPMSADLGGRHKWNRSLITDMADQGTTIIRADGTITRNGRKFVNSNFDNLAKEINLASMPLINRMTSKIKSSVVDSIKLWDDFNPNAYKGVSKSTKVVKGLGAIGTGFMIHSNYKDNFYVDGTWQYKGENVEEFLLDTTVDIAVGAGSAAAGAAAGAMAGTVFLPPVGTVVGAAAGLAVGFAMEMDFGNPPMSVVDHTKSFVNNSVDQAQVFFEQAGGKVAAGLSDVKETVGSYVSKLFF